MPYSSTFLADLNAWRVGFALEVPMHSDGFNKLRQDVLEAFIRECQHARIEFTGGQIQIHTGALDYFLTNTQRQDGLAMAILVLDESHRLSHAAKVSYILMATRDHEGIKKHGGHRFKSHVNLNVKTVHALHSA